MSTPAIIGGFIGGVAGCCCLSFAYNKGCDALMRKTLMVVHPEVNADQAREIVREFQQERGDGGDSPTAQLQLAYERVMRPTRSSTPPQMINPEER